MKIGDNNFLIIILTGFATSFFWMLFIEPMLDKYLHGDCEWWKFWQLGKYFKCTRRK